MSWFQLAPNWKSIARHSRSLRVLAVVLVLNGLDVIWPAIKDDLGLSKATIIELTFLLTMLAMGARLTYQPKIMSPPPVPPEEERE